MAIGKLPHTIVGAISVLVILGNFLHYLGNKIPIIRSYLGGGSVFCIFVSAFLATFESYHQVSYLQQKILLIIWDF